MRVTLDADQLTCRHEFAGFGGDPVEGMHVRAVHQLLGIAVNLFRWQVGCKGRAIRVLRPGEQMRFPVGRDEEALRRVEGPRVISGQVEEVRRVTDNKRAKFTLGHGFSDPPQPLCVLRFVGVHRASSCWPGPTAFRPTTFTADHIVTWLAVSTGLSSPVSRVAITSYVGRLVQLMKTASASGRSVSRTSWAVTS